MKFIRRRPYHVALFDGAASFRMLSDFNSLHNPELAGGILTQRYAGREFELSMYSQSLKGQWITNIGNFKPYLTHFVKRRQQRWGWQQGKERCTVLIRLRKGRLRHITQSCSGQTHSVCENRFSCFKDVKKKKNGVHVWDHLFGPV